MYVISGGRGLGATTALAYKCDNPKTPTICYSTDGKGKGNGTDGVFRQLQSLLNRFAAVAGFQATTPDGMIGPWTVNAVQKTVAWAQTTWGPSLKDYATIQAALGPILPWVTGATKEKVAAGANVIVQGLSQIAQVADLTQVAVVNIVPGAGGGSGGGGGSNIGPPPPGLDPGLVPGTVPGTVLVPGTVPGAVPPGTKPDESKLPYYIGGGLLAGALVYVAFKMLKKSNRNTPAAAAVVAGFGRARHRARPRRRYAR